MITVKGTYYWYANEHKPETEFVDTFKSIEEAELFVSDTCEKVANFLNDEARKINGDEAREFSVVVDGDTYSVVCWDGEDYMVVNKYEFVNNSKKFVIAT